MDFCDRRGFQVKVLTMKGPFTVILNPTANRGRAQRLVTQAAEAFEIFGLDAKIVEPPNPDAIQDLTRLAAAEGNVVVAMGGDGTVNMVARALTDAGGVMGIIPCGTGNDFAESIGIPVRDPMAAVELIATTDASKVDFARISTADSNQGVSCAVISMGFDSEVSATAERIDLIKGPARYTVAVFITLLKSSPATFTLRLDDDQVVVIDAWLVAVGNSTQYGGGMKITPDASITDGLLDLTIVGPVSKSKFVRTFPRVFKGTHIFDPDITTLRAKSLRVEADREFLAWADGEVVGPLPAEITVVPGGLSVIAPR